MRPSGNKRVNINMHARTYGLRHYSTESNMKDGDTIFLFSFSSLLLIDSCLSFFMRSNHSILQTVVFGSNLRFLTYEY